MGWADHVTLMRLMRNMQSRIKKGRDHFGDLGMNGRIMLKLKFWVFWNVAPFWVAVLCRWRQYTSPKRWLLQYTS
jgi:hypothetical protein